MNDLNKFVDTDNSLAAERLNLLAPSSHRVERAENTSEYTIKGSKIVIEDIPEQVWPSYKGSALYLLEHIIEDCQSSKIPVRSSNILDIGTGTGIIGNFLAKLGAQSVHMSDNNIAAVDLANSNVQLNDLDTNQHIAFLADVFPDNQVKYDIICGNFPMMPSVADAGEATAAMRSNENGVDGRGVLDTFIENAKTKLKRNGVAYLTTTTRQNYQLTERKLNENFGSNWSVINTGHDNKEGALQELDPNYINPYMMYLASRTNLDMIPRIFQLDKYNNPIINLNTDDKTREIITRPDNGKHLIRVTNGDTRIFYKGEYDETIQLSPDTNIALDLYKTLLELTPSRKALHHRYYIIKIENKD